MIKLSAGISVSVKRLFKFYGALEALHDIGFVVEPGEFFVILGPSGAGKSTLIKIIAGLEIPDAGDVFFGNEKVTTMPPHLRDVAVTFESYALYAHMTVYENIAFPLKSPLRRKQNPPEVIDKKVKKWAEFLGIGELLDRLPQQLSGGQRQRVALGRMLVREPKVFLMDEPIAHLDAKLRHFMRAELKNIQKELQVTTIYTTPDQLEALSMGDRIAVINHGKICQIGTPTEVFNQPADEWVANFIADVPMNIFNKVKFEEQNSTLFVTNNIFRIEFTDEMAQKIKKYILKNECDIGIRPHDVRWSYSCDEKFSIPACVEDIDFSGRKAVIFSRVGNLRVLVKVFDKPFPKVGDNIWLYFDINKFHFFDPITKRRFDI